MDCSNYSLILCRSDFKCVFVSPQAQKLKSNVSGSTHLCLSDVSCVSFGVSLLHLRDRAPGAESDAKGSETTKFPDQKKKEGTLHVPLAFEQGATIGQS